MNRRIRKTASLPLLFALLTAFHVKTAAQVHVDTTRIYTIDEVTVRGSKRLREMRSTTPLQTLDMESLRNAGALQLSDAVKMFNGVVIKDYGGIGGLKTVSVRSLGAAHTAVVYDGVAMSDAQTGQIDLGKISVDNVEAVHLSSGQDDDILQTARQFASANVLSIRTIRPRFSGKRTNLRAGVKGGSFGLVNPSACVEQQWNHHLSSAFSADYMHSQGTYPYEQQNGSASETKRRDNSDIGSVKLEANLFGEFEHMRRMEAKVYYYQSERGLPTNILYNDYAGQRLWDKNFFAQARFEKRWGSRWALLANGKYNWSYNRYYDPAVYNIAGHEDNRYGQHEAYASVAAMWRPIPSLTFSLANDASCNLMDASLDDFACPTRLTLLNVLAAKYVHERFAVMASLLSTTTREHVAHGLAAPDRHRLSPSVSLSVQPFRTSGLRIRLLYKDVFRLPTFNDLYYGSVGTRTLRPEKAMELNGGLSWMREADDGVWWNFSLTADAFYNRVTDKIVAVPTKNLFIWSMMNVGRVDIKGTEVSAQAELALVRGVVLRLNAGYTWQRALDKTDEERMPYRATYNHQIPYTPRHSGSVRFLVEMPWVSLCYSLVVSGERFCNQYNSAEYRMDGYQEHSLSAYRIFKISGVSLQAQVEALNLGGENYEVVKNYPMPGRQFRAGVTVKW